MCIYIVVTAGSFCSTASSYYEYADCDRYPLQQLFVTVVRRGNKFFVKLIRQRNGKEPSLFKFGSVQGL